MVPVPAPIRKLRWTYSADLQAGAYVRSEFQVVVSNWTVTGSGRGYSIAGPGSQRIEDNSHQSAIYRYVGRPAVETSPAAPFTLQCAGIEC